jgi:hypothetical protein
MSAVADALARFVHAIDDHDWDGVTAALADTVRRDYTSLSGGEPDKVAGPALAAEWRDVLMGLDGHQHLLGLPVVEHEGDEARAAVHVIGTHVLDGHPGSPWVVGGTYRFVLDRVGGRWRIAAITLDTRWQTGDAGILQRASESPRAAR